jgi:RNA polymerase sigma factor (sigma-70 family)
VNDRLSTDEMLAALKQWRGLALIQAKRFRRTNPALRLRDLFECALAAQKHAVLKFDPARGNSFSTVAYRYAHLALIEYCRVESARGMHVPSSGHDPYFAPEPGRFDEEWRHPTVCDERDDLGADFWQSVSRSLDRRDAFVLVRVFRDGLKPVQVAAELNLSRNRISQIVQRALEKLQTRADLAELAGAFGPLAPPKFRRSTCAGRRACKGRGSRPKAGRKRERAGAA